MTHWTTVYAAYDDAALAAIANPGLLRRARKDLAAGVVTPVSEDAQGAVVACGAARVRLGPKGPTAASCDCPTAGVCQHVVAACLWAREQQAGGRTDDAAGPVSEGASAPNAPSDGPMPAGTADQAGASALDGGDAPVLGAAGPAASAGPVLDPLAEIAGLRPTAVNRAAGKAAVRRVAASLPPAFGSHPTPDACTTTVDGPRARIEWPGGPGAMYLAGAGLDGMVVTGPLAATSEADRSAARLEAIVRVWARAGRPWMWPADVEAERSGALTDAQRTCAGEVVDVVERIVGAGLSHLGADATEQVRGQAGRARLAGLFLLHRLLLTAAGRLDALVDRDDSVSEGDVLAELAEAWGLAVALRGAPVELLPPLVGSARASVSAAGDEEHPGRFVPVAAQWWRSVSGARGATLTVWDSVLGALRTATNARAAGTDPGFQRDWDLPMMWGASLSRICAGPFGLDGAEERDDGSLSVTDRTRIAPTDLGFDALQLAELATRLDESAVGRDAVGFGRLRRRTRLVMVRDTGAPGVDEARQEITWPLVAADGTEHVLRLPADADHRVSVDALMSLVALRRTVVAVVAERRDGQRSEEPVSVFLRGRAGAIELFSLSMSPIHRTSDYRSLRRLIARIAALRRGALAAAPPSVQVGPVARVCGPVLDVAESLAATGRRHLTEHQREIVARRRGVARDMGMATVERAIAHLLDSPPTPAVVLRVRLVLGRAVALAE